MDSFRLALIALVRRIVEGDHQPGKDDDLLEQINCLVLDPQISDYMYWPDRPMTPAEIVDRALAYQPIVAGYSGAADSSED